MGRRLHRLALRCFRLVPSRPRRAVVRWIAPAYTVGALCLIERDDGHVLLVRQAYRAGWGIPGGLVKRGEDIGAAARREVFEEIGLAIELVGAPAVVVDPVTRRVDVVHRARPAELPGAAEAHPASAEIVEVGWFDVDAFPTLQLETVEAMAALGRQCESKP